MMNEKQDHPIRVPVEYGRDKDGKIDKIRLVPFKPGMVIHRCGCQYVLDKHGTQRLVK